MGKLAVVSCGLTFSRAKGRGGRTSGGYSQVSVSQGEREGGGRGEGREGGEGRGHVGILTWHLIGQGVHTCVHTL